MFSKATEYALRASIYIAQKSSEENKLSIDEIADAIDSPKSFTAKILQSLTKGNKILCSVRGPNGGFYFTEKAKKLPVRVVLHAMGESEMLEKCVLGLKKCSELKPCPMHSQYKHIKEQIINLFENKTIEQLSNDIENNELFINNKRK